MDLHFVYNDNTPSGDKDVPFWDDYQIKLHQKVSLPKGIEKYHPKFNP